MGVYCKVDLNSNGDPQRFKACLIPVAIAKADV
jgi:hypothetical protein